MSPQEVAKLKAEGKWLPAGPGGHCYKYVLAPPGYLNSKGKPTRYIPEHVLVMEASIGRRLTPNEIVNHENTLKDDNRLENLRICLKKAHFGTVCCPKCKYEFRLK